MEAQYKYDLAISLNKENLPLAHEIVKYLEVKRERIFLYENRQMELLAEDAISNFSQVFKYDARIVLIMYEENWGKTPYTMIEETAIKERMLLQGYDFIVFLKVKPDKLPVWYPETFIYLKQVGLPAKAIAQYIAYRIEKAGGNRVPLTLSEKVSNLRVEIKKHNELLKWENTDSANVL